MRGLTIIAIAAISTSIHGYILPRQEQCDSCFDPVERDCTEDCPQINAPQDRAKAVKDAFLFAWNGYYANAFPNDELHPVTNTSSNSRNGWGASAIDALSTAIIMDLKPVVTQILNYIPTVNFTATPKKADSTYVSLFETTIRYLGGMVSAYDLLKGPFAHLVSNDTQTKALLAQAQSLANSLSYAFESKTGIPSNNLNLNKRETDGASTNGLATVGTLILEWQRLSDLTGNQTYGKLVEVGQKYLMAGKYQNVSRLLPGLQGSFIDINSGEYVNQAGGWGAESDSYYEYLIKMFVYDQSRYSSYATEWSKAANSTIRGIASHPSTRPDLTFLPQWDGNTTANYSQHLACFAGGNFILGGTVLNYKPYVDFGLQLVNGCRNTYASTKTGIGPEVFSWDRLNVPSDQVAFYNKTGFWIASSAYITRPEVIESYYYAYRVTKDPKYQDWAWEAFQHIVDACKAESGFSSISDVNAVNGGNQTDFQESFLFAEVLKYSYMIFANDAEWQVENGGQNRWVFNTEAHPVKVFGKPV